MQAESSVINSVAWGYHDFNNVLALGCSNSVLLFDVRAASIVAKTPDNSFMEEHEDEVNHVGLCVLCSFSFLR